MTTHVQQTLPFLWQGGRQCSLQLLIQPWICAPGTHYGMVDRGSVEYEVSLTLLRMASTGNQIADLLILSPTPYPLGHMLLYTSCTSYLLHLHWTLQYYFKTQMEAIHFDYKILLCPAFPHKMVSPTDIQLIWSIVKTFLPFAVAQRCCKRYTCNLVKYSIFLVW